MNNNVMVVDDVKGEQDALDFMAKMKSVTYLKNNNDVSQYYCIFPNYSDTEFAMCFMGHHCLHDGRT